MEILSMLIAGIGGILALVFGIILLIKAFQQSILWGLGYILVPFVSLIFVIMHWEETKSPFLKGLLCSVVSVVGLLLMPGQQVIS
jgi:uncharacterized membrane protein